MGNILYLIVQDYPLSYSIDTRYLYIARSISVKRCYSSWHVTGVNPILPAVNRIKSFSSTQWRLCLLYINFVTGKEGRFCVLVKAGTTSVFSIEAWCMSTLMKH